MAYLIKLLSILFVVISVEAEELDSVAVIVNDGVVLESDIKQKISDFKKDAAVSGKRIPADAVLREEVIEELILEELQLQIAERVGIKISDEELNLTLKRLAQQNDMDLETFVKYVEDQGDSYEKVREDVRKSLKIQRVQQGRIQNKISITREELNNFLNTDEAKTQLGPELNVKQVLIRQNSSKEISQVFETIKTELADGKNSAELFALYTEDNNSGDLGWRKITAFPQVFQEPISKLKIGEFSEIIQTGAGQHVLYLENKRGPMVSFEKQWNVRHILLIPNRIRDEESSEMLLNDIRDRIINGASFDELAQEYSDDPGSKQEGGNLGWAGQGQYAAEFEEKMINSDLNTLTEPFLTQFGWHILEVLGTRVEDKTDENVADQAFSYLFNRKFQEELETDLQELRADAFIEVKNS